MTREEMIEALIADAYQVLDDMGLDGKCCCLAAKAALRVSIEPLLPEDYERDGLMPLDVAMEIVERL